ncbi:MAG TPA: pirin family protein [Polyangiaceae bacterium]|jgi:hypothetical protein|nr:pirin family protein [Polyangiaceae bacterium]
MLWLYRSEEFACKDQGWLKSRNAFWPGSSAPEGGFRSLRAVATHHIEPGRGFAAQRQRDLEIISYVVDGDFAYSDSRKNRALLRRGGLMRMSAGSGITHCEYNASKSNALQVLQLGFVPRNKGMSPTLEQLTLSGGDSAGRLCLLASPNRHGGSLGMHADARLYAGSFKAGEDAWHNLCAGRHVWVQVVRGWVRINDIQANAGDGVAISNEESIRIQGIAEGEVLLVDLA